MTYVRISQNVHTYLTIDVMLKFIRTVVSTYVCTYVVHMCVLYNNI